MRHNPVNKCVLVYSDGTQRDITNEFNSTLKTWYRSFYQLAQCVKCQMGAERIRFA